MLCLLHRRDYTSVSPASAPQPSTVKIGWEELAFSFKKSSTEGWDRKYICVCVYYICVLDYAKKDNPCSVGLDAGICLLGYKILLVISSAGNLRPQYSQTHLPGSGISWHICISQPWQRWC